ncbi:sensor histidine kinase [Leptospira gomenensis]|uniref:histidine kinase n=1 Tax=Leptospira gomenensis TaxID=2484974 RepID=A0A5F1YD80_9LEPT|nr:sensor histidine kinase [Leptospira gomenensis]TGK35951.1 sensor histidine kinase [Leptospira gomenensis]TGK40017.1 sensor histidine kinase [Leptospira gomenensis]TGK51467.1 sensor histidine kinase [Leptospira gomenensis]TGK68024.1 sensor histidine kinase [Leptospira gomenensis]
MKEFSAYIRRIYKDRDYLTRSRVLHLFVFNVASVLLGTSSNFFLWVFTGRYVRIGFSIMAVASAISLFFLLRKNYETALNVVLAATIASVTFGWFWGIPNIGSDVGNKNLVLVIFIMIFLYFTDVRKTILITIYSFALIMTDEFILKKDHGTVYTADRIGLFAMFTVISILAVKTLYGSVREKNELIQEIHHRVRNNLQVLSGLVEIHSDSGKADFQSVLSDFQNRILAISEVHNYLYKSENYFDIDFSEVIEGIVKNLSVKSGKSSIRIETSTERIFLRIENALPCAMIFSELLSNALSHAFPFGEGNVRIRFRKDENKFRLIVEDDGTGIPDSEIWRRPKTAGFTLVQILTKQIKGDFRILLEGGSSAVLEFGV